ncbi:hypothetical protein BV25DRAFT_1916132 [Artomyces pyxidatus]|uniref:Uncharacterized protein n=1 Tax=Artomyces pyxidatus TaxID=48021 RepID=A0ACB8T266_9AGAM|nr:hypothetical protein BV25DRAFT_1916132 [Artomyces pyxidatus]
MGVSGVLSPRVSGNLHLHTSLQDLHPPNTWTLLRQSPEELCVNLPLARDACISGYMNGLARGVVPHRSQPIAHRHIVVPGRQPKWTPASGDPSSAVSTLGQFLAMSAFSYASVANARINASATGGLSTPESHPAQCVSSASTRHDPSRVRDPMVLCVRAASDKCNGACGTAGHT